MKNLIALGICLLFGSVLFAKDIILVAKVGANVQGTELKKSLEVAFANSKNDGKIVQISSISPFAHHLLSEVGGIVTVSQNAIANDPFIKYLIPEGDSWVVSIQFQEKSRVLEELTLEFPTRPPATLKLGKPGSVDAYSLASPGVYNLFLDGKNSPYRFTMKYSDLGKSPTVVNGLWPELPRFYAIRIDDFKGDLVKVLKFLGDEKLMANPLSQITPANEFKLVLGDLDKRDVKTTAKTEDPKKPCLNCPESTGVSSKRGFGFFRR